VAPIPGLLLTGGASSRMGVPKATLVVGGESIADRAAARLLQVCDPVVEVGPGYSSLRRVDEDQPGRGPLAALVAGADAVGTGGPLLLLACDLPFVTEALLGRLVGWEGTDTVVPVDSAGRGDRGSR
jgi:molybdopterin-guanine dinucleotide biosynthesis protein A